MAKLVCTTSLLKTDDYRSKKEAPSNRRCSECDLYRLEDARHMVLECPALHDIRNEMFHNSNEVENRYGWSILNREDILLYLLGKQCPDVSLEMNLEFNISCAMFINRMYRAVLSRRTGISPADKLQLLAKSLTL